MNENTFIDPRTGKAPKRYGIFAVSIVLIVLNLPILILFISFADFSGLLIGEAVEDTFLPVLYSVLTGIYVGIIGLIYFRKIDRIYICFYLGISLVTQIALSLLYYFVLGIVTMGAQGLYLSCASFITGPFVLSLPVMFIFLSIASKTKEKKSIKQLLFILIFPVILIIFSLINFAPLYRTVTDDFEYRGEHPELYTAAQHSLPGQRGFIPDHHVRHGFDPSIGILEEDTFGRILFTYSEQEFRDQRHGYVLLIVQKVDDEFIYFYPHYNYIISLNHRNWEAGFMVEYVNELKEVNRWNQEMSEDSAFERIRISRQKESGPIPDRQLASAYRDIFPDTNLNDGQILFNNVFYFRTDSFGQSIYLFNNYAIFFDADHMVKDILDTTELYRDEKIESTNLVDLRLLTYQTELRLFMERNGWNTPP